MAQYVTIHGEAETIRKIKAFDMERKKMAADAIKKNAKAVKSKAKSIVPVSPSNRRKTKGAPGDLKRSIGYRTKNQGMTAIVSPNKKKGPHRAIVEYGTGQRRTKSGRNTGRMSAQPFMAPAERAQEAAFKNELKRIFNEDQTV